MTRASGSQEQDRRAVGGQRANGKTGVRVTRASASDTVAVPRLVDDHRRRALWI
jgi:hypothetical protein